MLFHFFLFPTMFSIDEQLGFGIKLTAASIEAELIKKPPCCDVDGFIKVLKTLTIECTSKLVEKYIKNGHLSGQLKDAQVISLHNLVCQSESIPVIQLLWPRSGQTKELAGFLLRIDRLQEKKQELVNYFNQWVNNKQGIYADQEKKDTDVKKELDTPPTKNQPVPDVRSLIDRLPPMKNQPDATDELGLCVVCQVRKACVTLGPCGHMCMCIGCAHQLVTKHKDESTCPTCRKKIESAIETFV